MLGQQDASKMTQEEKDAIQKETEKKLKMDEAAEQDQAVKAERIAREKEEDFDDLMSGKQRRNRELSHSENLAELYKQFYDKAKNTLDG